MHESRKSSQGIVIKQRLSFFSRDTHDNLWVLKELKPPLRLRMDIF